MRKTVTLLLTILMLFSIAGCGVDETAQKSSNTILSETTSSAESELLCDDEQNSSEDNTSNVTSGTSSKKNNQNKNPGSSGVKGTTTTSNSSMPSKTYPRKQKTIQIRKSNQAYLKKVGRCEVVLGTGVALNWSCASVEFDVDCIEDLAIDFSKGNGNSSVYVEIYVDGELIEDRTKIVTSGPITIAENLDPGVHRVKIVRQSDCDCPTLAITKIMAYGNLVQKAPENKPLYIEAIGDSSLIGWGVLLDDDFYVDFNKNSAEKQPIARNRDNQDGTLSYAYVAAERLNADAYILARQGVGIAATYHKKSANINGVSTSIGSEAGLLPSLYQLNALSGGTQYNPTRSPDVIVLDAGTADLSKSCLDAVLDDGKVGITTARAAEIAEDFLKSLKNQNPNAKIIWCYGLANNNTNFEKHVLEIVKNVGGETKGFYTLKLTTTTRSGYPSAKEYAAAADLLVKKISKITK